MNQQLKIGERHINRFFLIFNWIFLVLVKKFVENFVLGIGTIFLNGTL